MSGEVETESPWHNFVSNKVQWKSDADDSLICTNNGGMIAYRPSIVRPLLAAGAKKIWGGEHKTSTLIGNPLIKIV